MKTPIRLAIIGALFSLCTAAFSQDGASAKAADPSPTAALTPEQIAELARTEMPGDRMTLKYSNKWRITFDNEAKSDGTLVFRMVMKNSDAEPVMVTIPIKKGINENNIADIVEDALQKAFPRDFNIETDDGESVLVKLNFIEGSSSLVLLSNDVKSLKIKIRKE
jgi:hypothetical protein